MHTLFLSRGGLHVEASLMYRILCHPNRGGEGAGVTLHVSHYSNVVLCGDDWQNVSWVPGQVSKILTILSLLTLSMGIVLGHAYLFIFQDTKVRFTSA